jgi:RNA polymerase sigma-70 factor (ECF subfamily)
MLIGKEKTPYSVNKLMKGDRDEFGKFIKAHKNMVYAIAYSYTSDLGLAEDLSQDIFLKAYQSISGLKEPSKIKPWLASIARFTGIDYLRKKKDVSEIPFEELNNLPSKEKSPDNEYRVIDELLAELSEEHRQVILLRYVEGLSYKEIAELLETTVSSVGEKLSRIRDTLREKFRSKEM